MNKFLVVIDMQNDFITGTLGSAQAQAVVEPVKRCIEDALNKGYNIVFTMDTHGEDYLFTDEGKRLPIIHCQKGTEGWQIHKDLSDYAKVKFEKPQFSSMELIELLKNSSVDEVELVGLCTDVCVITNAMMIKSVLPECRVCVRESCCAGITDEGHRIALNAMAACHIDII